MVLLIGRRLSTTALGLFTATALLVGVPAPALAANADIVAEGVVHGGYYPEVYLQDATDIDGLGAASGRKVTFVGTFINASLSQGVEAHIPGKWNNTIVQLNAIWDAGATPFVNIKVDGTAAQIAAGQQDGNIADWASFVERWLEGENASGGDVPTEGRSLIIAPLQEMNWVGYEAYQCDPGNYGAAYRKFTDALAARGIGSDQVRWAFAPNGATAPDCGTMASYYPGDPYVDILAVSAYNQAGAFAGAPDLAPSAVLWGPFEEMRAIAPLKPFLVGQTAACTTANNRDQWIRDVFTFVSADPNAIGLLWFNFAKECDWRVWNGASASPGWRDGMTQTAGYAHPLSDWFVADTTLQVIIPDTPDLCMGAECDSITLVDQGARFRLRNKATRFADQTSFYFGNPGDFSLMGDWNCNGSVTPGQYRQSDGFVYLRDVNSAGNADIQFYFGNPGDIPIVGDFNGDGCDTVSIYRPGTSQVFIINELGQNGGGLGAAQYSYYFGNPGDKPFVGDFDGDGVATIGLHRESTGLVYFRNSHTSGVADAQFIYGDPGDKVLSGDWDGNGIDSVGLYRPGNAYVYLRDSNSAGPADASFYAGFDFTAILRAPYVS